MRSVFVLIAAVSGLAFAALVPQAPETVRDLLAKANVSTAFQARAEDKHDAVSSATADSDGHGHEHGDEHGAGGQEGPEGVVQMTPERVAAAKIEVATIDKGVLARRLTVPGSVIPDPDRIAHIAARVVGTVAELNKRLGDIVAKGETIAVLDSREVAEARSELLSALVNLELQTTLFEREQSLWDKKISAEQQYLKVRNSFAEAQLRVDLAHQKLTALGLSDKEIAAVGSPVAPVKQASFGPQVATRPNKLQRYELRSPIAGRVVERRVDLGAPVGGEDQEKEVYVIADLSSVWVELSIPTGDLPQVREGQAVQIITTHDGPSAEARIVFVSPLLNQDTRSARVIASLDNKDLTWRPGSYVTAHITVEEQPVNLRLPRSALQTINGEQVVFVRTEAGFEKREVVLGKGDDTSVEVTSGLDPGEQVAVANTFVLKAELGKAEAEHSH
ncbi:efflux RND transporter periplasmic adaptor subunit [Microvirga sp. VF16]|uniref:efflux RND transporter periplasmic adaptor subunit n=1 Tax=Microvirga sp. VF16 TaxID=2807101 RepID=UPI00352FF5D7